jgi:class 3 adenylate cyclase
VGGILFSGLFAFFLRTLYELVLKARENEQLRAIFGSYVSADTLRAMMSGDVQSRLEGERKRVCILSAYTHDFGAHSEDTPPQELITLLNEYFSEMTVAIHQHNGTVGIFSGDAILAYFGAPQALECPEKNALEAAQEMLLRLRELNVHLKEKGIVTIEIGIGLHIGEVVVGNVGSESRREYTAVGEVVNITARLGELGRSLGYPVICSKAVAEAVDGAGGLNDLGEQVYEKGNSLHVFGWYPPLLVAN